MRECSVRGFNIIRVPLFRVYYILVVMISNSRKSREQDSEADDSLSAQSQSEAQPLPEGYYVDLYDQQQEEWRPALVLERNQRERTYRLRYEGTANREETLSWSSNRICQFRSRTVGLPSLKPSAQIKAPYKFVMADHIKKQEKLSQFRSHPLQGQSIQNLIQFIRGSHPFYADHLLMCRYLDRESIRVSILYLLAHLQLTGKYMQQFDATFKKFHFIEGEPQSSVSEQQSRYAHAFMEIFQVAIAILGGTPRYTQFVKENKELLNQLLDYRSDSFERQFGGSNFEPYYRLLFAYPFCRNGGLDHFTGFITRLLESEAFIPFNFLRQLIMLYGALDKTISSDLRTRCPLINITNLIRKNIAKITDKQMKSQNRTNQDAILEIIKKVKLIASTSFEWQGNLLNLEYMELDLSLKYLKGPIFDRKLRAITLLKETLEKTSDETTHQRDYNKEIPQQMTAKQMFQWTQSIGMIEYVLTESPHPEILKKAGDIIRLFCKARCPNNNHVIDLLWNARFGHEATTRVIDDIIINLVPDLGETPGLIDYIYTKMESVAITSWNQEFLQLVKKFTLKAVKIIRNRINGVSSIYNYFLLKKDDNSLTALAEILNENAVMPTTQRTIKMCLSMIEKGNCAFEHIRLLHAISSHIKISALADSNPIEIIITDIKRACHQIATLQKRLDLLDSLLEFCKAHIGLRKEDVRELWEIFRSIPEAFPILLKYFLRKDQKRVRVKQSFSLEVRDFIFTELLCPQMEAAPSPYDQPLLQTFEAFFRDKNEYLGYLECPRDSSKFVITNPLKLVGRQSLWSFFLKAHEPASARSCQLLLDLHTRLAESKRQQFGTLLINNALQRIRLSLDNNPIVIRCVDFLRRFIDRTEKRDRKNQEEEKSARKQDEFPDKSIKRNVASADSSVNQTKSDSTTPETNFVKRELIKNQKLLLSMLATQAAPKAWSILEQLPFSEEIMDSIHNFTVPFSQIFTGTIYYELYILKFLQKQKWSAWWDRFIDQKGITVLLNKLTMQIENPIQQVYYRTLTSILVKYYENPKRNGEDIKQVSLCLLSALQFYLKYLCKRDPGIEDKERHEREKNLIKNMLLIILKNDRSVDIVNFSGTLQIIQMALLSSNSRIRNLISNDFIKIIEAHPNQIENHRLVARIMTDLFQVVIKTRPAKAYAYFSFAQNLIEATTRYNITQLLLPKLPVLFESILKIIQTQKHQSKTSFPNDILGGCLGLLRTLLIWQHRICSQEEAMHLVEYLLNECLFNFKGEFGPKCKFEKTRHITLKLVLVIVNFFDSAADMLCSILGKYFSRNFWRICRDYEVIPRIKEKSKTGYVGLDNPGCICYMNSFFQQMYMIPSLRQAVLQSEDPQREKLSDTDNVLYQLKAIFYSLLKSDIDAHDARNFCMAFKDLQGRPTNMLEQMDVDEFASLLFDRLQNQLKDSKNFIKDHFGGVLANQIVCQDCPHFSEREEAFLSIPLQVKDKKNIYQGMEAMVKGEILEGDNAYHCDTCGKKVKAVKRVSLKRLPNHLIIVLKRFEFNYDNMSKIKLNDFCEFPMELDLKPYSQQYLVSNEGRDRDLNLHQPDEYFQYELKGCVIHMGFADTGHYLSFIKQRSGEEKWYSFNDDSVNEFDPDSLPEEAFGGEDKTFHVWTPRRRNAYVLVYDRKNLFNPDGTPQMSIEKPMQFKRCQQFQQKTEAQNESLNMQRLIFSKDLFDFFRQLTSDTIKSNLLKLSLKYFLSVIVRHKQKSFSFELARNLIKRLQENKEVAVWLLCLLLQPNIVREFFYDNPSPDIRKLIGNLIVHLWSGCGQDMDLKDAVPLTILSMLTQKGVYYFSYTNELYMIIVKICRIDPRKVLLLLQNQALGRLTEIFSEGVLRSYEKTEGPMIILPEDAAGFNIDIRQFEQVAKKTTVDEVRTYLWYLLSLLLGQSTISKGQYKPTTRQMHLLTHLPISFNFDHDKLLLRKMCDFWCILATNNEPISDLLLKAVENGIVQDNYRRYRMYFTLYKWLALIPDSFQDMRVEFFVNVIRAVSEEKHLNQCFSGQMFLLKIVRKNQKIQEFLKGNEQCRIMIRLTKHYRDKWLQPKHHRQKQGQISKLRKFIDKTKMPLHGIRVPRNGEAYYSEMQKNISQWQSLFKGNFATEPSEWQSDDDLAEHSVLPGEKVGLFTQKYVAFCEATIKQMYLDYMIMDCENKLMPCWKDSELLSVQSRPDNCEQYSEDYVEQEEEAQEAESSYSNDMSSSQGAQ